MLRLHLSFARQDGPYFEQLYERLRPLEEKYFLRIWPKPQPKKPPQPPPQPFLPAPPFFGWLFDKPKPPKNPPPYHPQLPEQVSRAHLYLFLTSPHSLAVKHINGLEIDHAVGRHLSEPSGTVRIFPVPLTESLWKEHSRLAGFQTLPEVLKNRPVGPKWVEDDSEEEEEEFEKSTGALFHPGRPDELKNLLHLPTGWWSWTQSAPVDEAAWSELLKALEKTIVEMRRTLLEEAHLKGQPTDDFFRPEPPPPPPPQYAHDSTPLRVGAWGLFFWLFYEVYQLLLSLALRAAGV